MAFIIAIFEAVFGEGARYFLEQNFQRNFRFGVEMGALDLGEFSYNGRRIYTAKVRTIVTGPYDIKIREIADGSGDGVVFFPTTYQGSNHPSIIAVFEIPDIGKPRKGSIGMDEVSSDGKGFTLYIATEKPLEKAYFDIRFTVLDEKQTEKRALLRLPLAQNH